MDTDFGEVAAAAATAVPVGNASTVIIAVDGFGGAGKSTLAARFATQIGAVVLHTDDFASWDNPLDWWPGLLEQLLVPLSRNDTARYRRYDWDRRALAEWAEVQPGGIVIIEGVSSSRRKFLPFLSRAIWVDAPRGLRLARGLERDGDGMREQWLEWMEAEDAWAGEDRARDYADFVVRGDGSEAKPPS